MTGWLVGSVVVAVLSGCGGLPSSSAGAQPGSVSPSSNTGTQQESVPPSSNTGAAQGSGGERAGMPVDEALTLLSTPGRTLERDLERKLGLTRDQARDSALKACRTLVGSHPPPKSLGPQGSNIGDEAWVELYGSESNYVCEFGDLYVEVLSQEQYVEFTQGVVLGACRGARGPGIAEVRCPYQDHWVSASTRFYVDDLNDLHQYALSITGKS